MPEISRFLGMVVFIYHNDHPPPHVHVRYSEHRARVAIEDGRILDGNLPTRVRGLIVEWITLNRPAIQRNWERARRQEPLERVPPLE